MSDVQRGERIVCLFDDSSESIVDGLYRCIHRCDGAIFEIYISFSFHELF